MSRTSDPLRAMIAAVTDVCAIAHRKPHALSQPAAADFRKATVGIVRAELTRRKGELNEAFRAALLVSGDATLRHIEASLPQKSPQSLVLSSKEWATLLRTTPVATIITLLQAKRMHATNGTIAALGAVASNHTDARDLLAVLAVLDTSLTLFHERNQAILFHKKINEDVAAFLRVHVTNHHHAYTSFLQDRIHHKDWLPVFIIHLAGMSLERIRTVSDRAERHTKLRALTASNHAYLRFKSKIRSLEHLLAQPPESIASLVAFMDQD